MLRHGWSRLQHAFVAFSVYNWEKKMKRLRIAGGMLALAAGLLFQCATLTAFAQSTAI
jgi:hypothetical protein